MNIDLTDKNIMNKMGVPFWPYAVWFGINLDQIDLDYIVNVIKRDRCFPLIIYTYKNEGKYKSYMSELEKAYAKINIIVFFDKFYNDPQCPKGVKLILFTMLGLYRDYLNETYSILLSERYAYVERWLETVK